MPQTHPYLPQFDPESIQPSRVRPLALGRSLTRDAAAHALPPGWERLSAREREVAEHILAGWTDARIAEALTLSINTVRTHARQVLHKTGCARRSMFRYRYAADEGCAITPNPVLPDIPAYPWGRLTRTQKQVVSLCMHGFSEQRTADRLEVGLPAVRKTMQRALAVLGVASVGELRRLYRPPAAIEDTLPDLPRLPGEDRQPLTLRQRHVLTLRLQGHPPAAIAAQLQVSTKAVQMLLSRLRNRMGFSSEQDVLNFFSRQDASQN